MNKRVKRCPDTFGELPLTGILPSRNSEIIGTILIIEANAIFKHPVNKPLPIENTYQDTNQTDMAREQKLRRETVVTSELKRTYECYLRKHCGRESLNIKNINLLIRFYKTREIFPSVARVLSILLSTSATSASVERVNFKGYIA